MKLNPDCVRSILLFLEENQSMDDNGQLKKYLSSELAIIITGYTKADVIYSVKQMDEFGYISARQFDTTGYMSYILDITPLGHEFLKDIHNDNNWNKVKGIAEKVGSYSLSALSQIASAVITSIITSSI